MLRKWTRAKFPDIEPLVVAVPVYRNIQACFVVKASSPAKSLADLKGGKVAIPRSSKDHVRLYFDKLQGGEPAEGAACEVVTPSVTDEALECVLEGTADCAFVDASAFAAFEDNKPGRAKQLKTLSESDPFPPGIIAFKKGGIDAATLKKCREGLLKSETDVTASVILRMMKLKGFDVVPSNIDDVLKKSIDNYPAPVVEPTGFKP